jgi:hypothetical protein
MVVSVKQKSTDQTLPVVATLRKDIDCMLPSSYESIPSLLGNGAPISVITIHLWASVYKSEIDRGIEDLIDLRHPVSPVRK